MLNVSHVTFAYPKKPPILKNVSFTIAPGDSVALIGFNGAGKSTLFRLITGQLAPDSGTISINNEILSPFNKRMMATYIGAVGQGLQFNPELTVGEYVEITCALHGIALGDALAHKHLNSFNVASLLTHKIKALSGGQRQRFQFVLSLLHLPNLLLLDEPSTGLDIEGVFIASQAIREHCTSGGCAFLISHNMDEIDGCCSRVLAMSDGGVTELTFGTRKPSSVIREYACRAAAEFNSRKDQVSI